MLPCLCTQTPRRGARASFLRADDVWYLSIALSQRGLPCERSTFSRRKGALHHWIHSRWQTKGRLKTDWGMLQKKLSKLWVQSKPCLTGKVEENAILWPTEENTRDTRGKYLQLHEAIFCKNKIGLFSVPSRRLLLVQYEVAYTTFES